MDGEDGVGAGALHVHLGAGRGARQGALLQALDQLGSADVRTSWLQSPAPAPSPQPPGGSSDAHLLLGADEAGGDARGVDAAVGILVDLDVGPAVAGVRVAGAVEEVEDLLVVELCGRKTAAGCRWVRRGPGGSLSCHRPALLCRCGNQALGGDLATPGPLWALAPGSFPWTV